MKYVYASRMGHVEELINNLNLEAMKIISGDETIDEDFILFTYTDGHGIVPASVVAFLEKNGTHLKGVVASGSMERHADTFAWAGDIISKDYNVPCLYKVDGSGTQEDIEKINAYMK